MRCLSSLLPATQHSDKRCIVRSYFLDALKDEKRAVKRGFSNEFFIAFSSVTLFQAALLLHIWDLMTVQRLKRKAT